MSSFLYGVVFGGVGAWLITWLAVRASYRRLLDNREQKFNARQRQAQAMAWQEGFDAGTLSPRQEVPVSAQAVVPEEAVSPVVEPPEFEPAQATPQETVQEEEPMVPSPETAKGSPWFAAVEAEALDRDSPYSRTALPARAPHTWHQVPPPSVGEPWEAAGVVVPQWPIGGPTLTPEELAEQRNLRNINLTLGTAGLLLLGACAAFLATGFAGSLKMAAIGLVMVLFYAGGLFVYARFPKLRAAGMALAGIGLGLVPFFGLALNLVGNLSPAWCWFLASLLGLAGSTVAVWFTRSEVLVYVGMALVLSTLWSLNAVAQMPVLWYYVSAVFFAVLVSAGALLRPGWVPAMVMKSARATYRYLLPTVIVAAGLSVMLLSTQGYVLLAALVTVAYALQLPVARGVDLVIAYFGTRAAGTVGLVLALVLLQENMGWPSSFWIAVVAAAFVLLQFFVLRYRGNSLPVYQSGAASRGVYVADLAWTFGIGVFAVLVIQFVALLPSGGLPGAARVDGFGGWIAVLLAWLALYCATGSLVSASAMWRGGEPNSSAQVWVPLVPVVVGVLANFEWNAERAAVGSLAPFVALALNGFAFGRLGWTLWGVRRTGGNVRHNQVSVVALKVALLGLPLTINGALTRSTDADTAERAANGDYAAWGVVAVAAVLILVDLFGIVTRQDTWLGGRGRGGWAGPGGPGELRGPSGPGGNTGAMSGSASGNLPAAGLGVQWLLGFAALLVVLHRGQGYGSERGFAIGDGVALPWLLVAWYLLGAIAGGIAVVRMLPRIGLASALGPFVALLSIMGMVSFEPSLPGLRVGALLSAVVAIGVVLWISWVQNSVPEAATGDGADPTFSASARVRTIRDSYLVQVELSIMAALAVLFADSAVPFYLVSMVMLGALTLLLVSSVMLRRWVGDGPLMQANRYVLFALVLAFPLIYLALAFVGRHTFSADTAGMPSALMFLVSGVAVALAGIAIVQLSRASGQKVRGGWSTYWGLLTLPYALGLIALSLTRNDMLSSQPVHLGVINTGWTALMLGVIVLAVVFALAARLRRGPGAIPVSLALVCAGALGFTSFSFAAVDDTPQFFVALWFLMLAIAGVRLGYTLGRGLIFLVFSQLALIISAVFLGFQVRANVDEPWPTALVTTVTFGAVVAVSVFWWGFEQVRSTPKLVEREPRVAAARASRFPTQLPFLAVPTLSLFISSSFTVMHEQGGALLRLGSVLVPGVDTPVNMAWLGALGVLIAVAMAYVIVPKQWRITTVEVSALVAVWPVAVIVQAVVPGLLTSFWLGQLWLVVITVIGAWEALRSRYLLGTVILAIVGAGLGLSMITLSPRSVPESVWGTAFALALLGLGITLRRRDVSGLIALASGAAATVAGAQALYQSITDTTLDAFWFAQWWTVALATLALVEFFRGRRQWGTIGFAVASGALLLSEASTIVFPRIERQVYTLLAMAVVLVIGVLTKSRLFTWMGAAGVAGAVIWFLRGYTFVLLGLLAVALLTFAVLRLRKVAGKGEEPASAVPPASSQDPSENREQG